MPVVIDEMTSHFDVRDESKTKKLVRQEIKAALEAGAAARPRGGGHEVDPADPSASGRPGEGGG